jgi:hypothetical protein
MSDSLNNPLDSASEDDAWLNLADDEPQIGVPPCVKRVVICGDQVHIKAELESDPAVRINVTDPRTLMQLVAALEQANVRRLFYRPGGTAVDQSLCDSLQEKGIDAVPISESTPDCDAGTGQSNNVVSADDFMDEADSDLVAQRLRELGYL